MRRVVIFITIVCICVPSFVLAGCSIHKEPEQGMIERLEEWVTKLGKSQLTEEKDLAGERILQDEEDDYIEEKSEDEYIIEGKTPLEELEERFNITFDEEEFETLNGFMISKLDRIPVENEEFDVDVDGYNFKILSVENKMIQSVLVTKLKQEMASGTEKGVQKLEQTGES